MSGFLGKFVPDVEPVTILLVNALTTNFDFNRLDEEETNIVDPAEIGRTDTTVFNSGESYLKVDTVN